MVVETPRSQQPTIGYLLKQLVEDASTLLTQHIELFRCEIKKEAEIATKYTAIAIAGAMIAYTSLIFLGFFIIFTLALFMPLWISSLIVTVLYSVIAIIALIVSKYQLKKLRKEQEYTIKTTQKTAEEAKRWLQDLK